ncbi:MAG: heavy metal sensor histidine kinase, partial [Polaromonas sp.]|nr:heavy metal sensor histidine kinase [Polaromonas sp.]
IGHDDLHLALADSSTGQSILSFSRIAEQSMPALAPVSANPDSIRNWTASTGENMSTVGASTSFGDGRVVRYYLSLDRRQDNRLLTGFVKTSLVGWPLMLLIVALGAWLIARTSLAPLRRFGRLAATVGTQSLSQRISSSGLPAELFELAEEFNSMLERIDEGYRRLQDFSGELAHEMRTPVATLMGRTQVALSRSRNLSEFREVLEGNVEELERLTRLIADMLFIASAEHGQGLLRPEPVDLRQEACRIVDYMSMVAEERDLRVSVKGTATVQVDRLLVQRAITNILSNALRHAVPNSNVSLEISAQDGYAALAVTNQGQSIAPEHLSRIFDRFYRIDSGRARLDGGSGLGLAIVRSIMAMHGGLVKAHSSAGGETTFTLTFRAIDG